MLQARCFSYVRLEERVPQDHPLRGIRAHCDAALTKLDPWFVALETRMGRPSIPPEMLLRAPLLQADYRYPGRKRHRMPLIRRSELVQRARSARNSEGCRTRVDYR